MRPHRQLTACARLVIDSQHLVGDAVAFDDAGRTGRVVGPHRLAQTAPAVFVREPRRRRHQ